MIFRTNNRLIRKRPSALSILLAAGLIFSGCARQKPQPEVPARPVKIVAAIQKDVPRYLESFGNLASPNDVDIVSQVTGKIQAVHFEEGDEVKPGDLLFSIDPEEYRATLEKAKAELAGSQADLKLKQETLQRNKELIKKKLISQQDFDTYEADVAAARAAVRLDQAAVRLAEINLSYCSITSPINGRTGRRQVDPGNIVTANTGPILVNIKTVDPLYVDFTISERDFARVRDNMARGKLKVQIMAEEDGRGPCQGELQFADNTIDNSTGTVSLRAGVSNKKRRLWPGQYVTVKLIVETAENAVVVPGEAVQLGQKGMYLYVVTDDNKADLRDQIEVGDAEDGELIIEKGLRAGEKVVTSGQLGLSPGVKVQIITDQKEKPVSDPSPAKSGNKGSGEQ